MAYEGEEWMALDKQEHIELPDGRTLYLKSSGPKRTRNKADTSAVVLVHGLGGAASEWLEVQRRVACFAPVLLYERGGYYGSDPAPSIPTCANIAAELRSPLEAADIQPPYLLIGHSYGGLLVRQFLAENPSAVSGMVLIDSPPVVERMPADWTKLLGPSNYEEVVSLQANIGISKDEYKTILLESKVNEAPGGIAEKELEAMFPANQALDDSLQGQQLLGN
jgi:pimeloyl-ACP methyl ester carboxylesterase